MHVHVYNPNGQHRSRQSREGRITSSAGITTVHSPSGFQMQFLKYASVRSLISWKLFQSKSANTKMLVLRLFTYFYRLRRFLANYGQSWEVEQRRIVSQISQLNLAMLVPTCSRVIAHSYSIYMYSFRSIVEASPSRKYGTVMAMIGATKNLVWLVGCQGMVALPPMMARVSMAAAGAIVVKNELWMIFDDFRKVQEDTFLMAEEKDSAQVRLLPRSIPSFLAFSITIGVLISKYSSILSSKSCVFSICMSHSEAQFNKFQVSDPTQPHAILILYQLLISLKFILSNSQFSLNILRMYGYRICQRYRSKDWQSRRTMKEWRKQRADWKSWLEVFSVNLEWYCFFSGRKYSCLNLVMDFGMKGGCSYANLHCDILPIIPSTAFLTSYGQSS